MPTHTPTIGTALKRYRLTFVEELLYTVDVLAVDEEAAETIARDVSDQTTFEALSFELNDLTEVDHDDDFSPANTCGTCGAVIEDACPSCTAP